jgi:tRNA(fMet)-specific endonuclease VapC
MRSFGVKNLLIDTNIYTHALRGDQQVVSMLRGANKIGISSISLGELLSGFKAGAREARNREELMAFLDSPRVEIYAIDEDTAEFYAEIMSRLRKLGKPIPTNDIWIAATAFQHGMRLFSKDGHFQFIPGLMLAS